MHQKGTLDPGPILTGIEAFDINLYKHLLCGLCSRSSLVDSRSDLVARRLFVSKVSPAHLVGLCCNDLCNVLYVYKVRNGNVLSLGVGSVCSSWLGFEGERISANLLLL